MKKPALISPSASDLASAAAALKAGQLVALPTDTVYGIAAQPDLPAAVNALFIAKSRPRSQPLPVLVGSIDQAEQVATLGPAAKALIQAFWPGALTLVVPLRPKLGWDLGQSDGTVALRQPNHPTTLALLELVGPLAVSSANRTGQPPALTASGAIQQLGNAVAVTLDAGPSPGQVPSSLVALDQAGHATVLREGPIGKAEMARTLQLAELGDW